MFKDKMYRELRDGLELYERARQDEAGNPQEKIPKEAVLCEFLRKEKEEDIRLNIRRCRLALANAKEAGRANEYERELEGYEKVVIDYLEQNPKLAAELKFQRDTLHELIGIEKIATQILDSRKDSGRKDPYITLQECYLDYQLGLLEEQAVYEKACEVFGANRKYRVRKGYKEKLKDSGKDRDIDLIVEELSTAILVAQAKAFLYDAGYPYDTGKSDEVAVVKNTGRRRDQIMDLVDLYIEKGGRNSIENSAALMTGQSADYRSAEFKKQCLTVYDALQEEGGGDICLPLYIDGRTGAGIYIIGREYFDRDFLIASKKRWQKADKEVFEELTCHFCCLYWGEIRQDELADLDVGFPVTILVDQVHGNDIDAVIEEYQFGQEQNYGVFRDVNGNFRNGLDKRYRMYFEETFEEEDEIATIEEWSRMREKELKERANEAKN